MTNSLLAYCSVFALAACGGSTSSTTPDGGFDAAAPLDSGFAEAAVGCSRTISFELAVDASSSVYYYGDSQSSWPAQLSCPRWLTIDYADAALILNQGDCGHTCTEPAPVDAGTVSLTWDGTYYPVPSGPSPIGACAVAECAPAGTYQATFCVALAVPHASPEEAPPTCKTVSFDWPPSTPNQVISETITPTPDGG